MPNPTLVDLSDPAPDPSDADWNDDGVVVLPGLIASDLIAQYMAEWQEANGWRGLLAPDEPVWGGPGEPLHERWLLDATRPGGWPDCTPYMRHAALRRLVCDPGIAAALHALLGEPAAVHLNLTGWVTTERNWHQDGYLNPPEVGDYYAAVWIALGNVHPDSGPFQYIPGSHRWHRLTREKIGAYVDLNDPAWPKHSEDVLTPLVEARLVAEDIWTVTYLPKAGDVLIWHPRLYHRGTAAALRGAYRPALIAHYSGILHRPDMPPASHHEAGGWYFALDTDQPVR